MSQRFEKLRERGNKSEICTFVQESSVEQVIINIAFQP